MRVAVSATGPALADKVDERFGRAAYFIFVDTATMEYEAVDNEVNRSAMQGAGIAAVELVAEHKAEAVLATELGPKAANALRLASIPAYSASGSTVREAVAAFEQDGLERLLNVGEPKKGAS
ncbi:MAG: NifB/NifX family molybdenum-iron cluster-binding protein [Gaiellaceae bacterium]